MADEMTTESEEDVSSLKLLSKCFSKDGGSKKKVKLKKCEGLKRLLHWARSVLSEV